MVAGADKGEVFEIVAERKARCGLYQVGAFGGVLDERDVGVIDDIGVVASAAADGTDDLAMAAVEGVVAVAELRRRRRWCRG